MIKAITFDLDGEYFPESGKKGFHKRLVDLVQDEERVVHALYKSPEMLQLVTDQITPEEFVTWFNSYLDTEFSVDELGLFWTEDYQINQEVQTYIHNCRKAGYVTCTCSNNNKIRVNALEKRFGFLDDFDVVIFSYEYGSVKPNKKIYQTLIKQSQVEANELVYSDDNPERIQGAIDLGINTFVYQDFEQFKAELNMLGVNINNE